MSLIAPLFIALSEFLTSGRSAKDVAEENGLRLPDLSGALKGVHQHSWHGKLAAALADPHYRADLIPLLIHLARLERHHADLVAQFDRAKDLTRQIRSQKEIINLQDYVRAEAFTFKVEQAIGRVLRDIQKTESRLEKAQKAASETEQASVEQKTRQKAPSVAGTPVSETRLSKEQAAVTPVVTDHQPMTPNTPPPDEEFQAVLIRHRERIKNTPAKDRPTLIARIIEQERAKQNRSVA